MAGFSIISQTGSIPAGMSKEDACMCGLRDLASCMGNSHPPIMHEEGMRKIGLFLDVKPTRENLIKYTLNFKENENKTTQKD